MKSGNQKSGNLLSAFLWTMEYPAHPDDLIREALRDGFDDDDVLIFAMLPERSYSGAEDVRRTCEASAVILSKVA